jgi:drug/metabolite transporter (DMT)-like permease
MLISVACFAGINLMVKYLPHIPATELVLFRSFITLAISLFLLKRKKVPPLGRQKNWLLVRGIAGTTALTLFFYTIQKMPLSAAVTIQYLSPFFTAFFAGILLKEKTHGLQWFFFLLSFTGIFLIKGAATGVSSSLLILGIISSVFSGIAYSAIRKLKEEHPLVVVLYFPLVATPIMAVISLYHWTTPVGWDWALLGAIGILTQIAQVYMTKAYQTSEVNTVAPLKYFGVLFALTWDIFLFGFLPNSVMILGIVLVILGVLLNLRFKAQLSKRTRTSA